METLYQIYFYTSIFIYPLITGPLAGWIFLTIIKNQVKWQIRIFWPAIVLVNIIGFFLLSLNLSNPLIEPGFFSCLITPIFAVLTILYLRVAGRRITEQKAFEDSHSVLLLGTLLIPILQLLTIFLYALLGPTLCEIGLRNCLIS